MDVVRETQDYRPKPQGDWDGTTRAGLLADLLAADAIPVPAPGLITRFIDWLSSRVDSTVELA